MFRRNRSKIRSSHSAARRYLSSHESVRSLHNNGIPKQEKTLHRVRTTASLANELGQKLFDSHTRNLANALEYSKSSSMSPSQSDKKCLKQHPPPELSVKVEKPNRLNLKTAKIMGRSVTLKAFSESREHGSSDGSPLFSTFKTIPKDAFFNKRSRRNLSSVRSNTLFPETVSERHS